MKTYVISFLFSAIWFFVVFVFFSDYGWYRKIVIGDWGFMIVNAITLFPMLIAFVIADKTSKPKQSSKH